MRQLISHSQVPDYVAEQLKTSHARRMRGVSFVGGEPQVGMRDEGPAVPPFCRLDAADPAVDQTIVKCGPKPRWRRGDSAT